MPNMDLHKTPMPSQAADIRAKNFDEVALGYTEEMAVNEATRCLNCKNMPCVQGCPVNIAIPSFIEKIKERRFEDAYGILRDSSSLPAICGRVCRKSPNAKQNAFAESKGSLSASADWSALPQIPMLPPYGREKSLLPPPAHPPI